MDQLNIADRKFNSRLFVGTGKFRSNEIMRDALKASETELVTVSLKRANLNEEPDQFVNILDFIDPDQYLILPNFCLLERKFFFANYQNPDIHIL